MESVNNTVNELIECGKHGTVAHAMKRECIISRTYNIVVGPFGPGYVVTGYEPITKYTFLAHIDDGTNVETISEIFKELQKLNVDLKNFEKICLLGGWEKHPESKKWGDKILKELEKIEGIKGKID